MFYNNIMFIFIKILHSHLFYDGLASTVPELSAQISVIYWLILIGIIRWRDRGLWFG